MSPMPAQKPGRSKQDYGTPPEFLDAVKTKLGITAFACDLAASAENTVADCFFSVDNSALDADVSWKIGGPDDWNWCNMPFEDIAPWVEKAHVEANDGVQSALLVPLSTANWWRDWVHDKARVVLLHGRLKFVGCDIVYPKDCALLLYGPFPRYELWSWRS